MRWIFYNVLFTVVYLLMLPRFVVRMCRRGGYAQGFMQRFGWYDGPIRARLQAGGRVWVHAVSVGEVGVALRFMRAYRARRPGTRFVLSTTTSTGHRVAAGRLGQEDVLIYFPADFPPIVRRVLALIRPSALILTECELWPNLIRTARRRRIPVMLLNGRISDASYRGYRRVRAFAAPVLKAMNRLLVQTAEDGRRLESLGAPPERIDRMGSVKYDVAEVDAEAESRARTILMRNGIRSGDLLWVGGSTWPGEERALIEAYQSLKHDHPSLRLVLVPRHAERRLEVEAVIHECGVSHVRRSAMPDDGSVRASAPDVLLVDTTGELMGFYACATVIFVGKSLTEHGGQNPIEPALYGKPVVVGPNMENFAEVIADFRAAQAVVEVNTPDALAPAMARLLADPAERARLGERAAAVVAARRGAIDRSVDRLLPIIEAEPPGAA